MALLRARKTLFPKEDLEMVSSDSLSEVELGWEIAHWKTDKGAEMSETVGYDCQPK